MSNQPIRVLHAPSTVGGNPQCLSRALQKLGVTSTSMTLRDNYFRYGADITLFKPAQSLVVRELLKLKFILTIPFNYDVVHYNFGTTVAEPSPPYKASDSRLRGWVRKVYSKLGCMMQSLELLYLKAFKIPLFVHYQGDDARQGEYCKEHYKFCIAKEEGIHHYSPESDAFKQGAIKRLSTYCDRIYAVNPDLLNVLPEHASFIPYSNIDLENWRPSPPVSRVSDGTSLPLRIGHAPSDRLVKGTRYIEKALSVLSAEGYEFELVLIEGLSNQQAREIYKSVDVVIDQVLAGWYGGLAVEVMALEKPVVVYIREQDLKYVDEEMRNDFPFIQANPDSLVAVLRNVLEMPRNQLKNVGKRGRTYVEKWHDPADIAGNIKQDYIRALESRGK